MDLSKRYVDYFNGDKKVNILRMVRNHPDWAANRIQVGERALSRLSPEEKRASELGEAELPASDNKSSFQFPEEEECVKYFKELHGTQGYNIDFAYHELYEFIDRKLNT